jgi:formiminotetrahydrofolate cyclodeaminase
VLSNRALSELLDDVAAKTAAPGGGTSAACTGALAAALVEMAASFASADEIARRAKQLRQTLLDLAEQDLDAYAPVLEALRLPRDDPDRGARLEAAKSQAADTPFDIATAAAEVARLADEIAAGGSRHLQGDAITGAYLAEAACAAAVRLVEINLADAPTDARLKAARAARQQAATARHGD